jgi:hypothetical protein
MEWKPFHFDELSTWTRIAVASVWFVFGLAFKVLRLLPRHERIVARIVGERIAPVLTRAIGVGEVLLGLWMLSGIAMIGCALVQTLIIATMNVIEIRRARELLLAPLAMVLANCGLIGLAWFSALR